MRRSSVLEAPRSGCAETERLPNGLRARIRARIGIERAGADFMRFYGIRGALAEYRAGRLRYVGRGLFQHTPVVPVLFFRDLVTGGAW